MKQRKCIKSSRNNVNALKTVKNVKQHQNATTSLDSMTLLND